MDKDSLYALPLKNVGDFAFDDQVVQVFPDMISRSVPGYGSILAMIGEVASRYVLPHTQVYDLGCSLGACSMVIQPRLPATTVLHAIDSSQAMINKLTQVLESAPPSEALMKVQCADIENIEIQRASLTVLNFTLQFIAPHKRESLLKKIADGTVPGGALVLSEKIVFPNLDQQELLEDLHHSFKRANGYTELEIAQKRTALEKTLLPETLEVHLDRLRQVGFRKASCWFQCFNFVSILAVK